ncbi:hypothetical protein IPN41_00320 [Candidatus Falkowbacteria bacterium]|nr:MAG: hypothetical protein IPN41_00320 [Candidatus Falkowbacteria bacterium]
MKKFGWTLFYIFIFSLLIFNSFSYLDPDFGWHLRFGEIIWQTKSLPHDQIFLWTLEGKTWVDHEWLANLLMYSIWSVGGYILVSIIFALLPLLTIFIINKFLFTNFFKTIETRVATAVFETIAVVAMLPHLGVRIQEVTLFAVSILIIILSQLHTNREKLLPWWLPVFFYLWACLHAGFFIGLIILFIWICCETLLYYIPSLQKFGIQPLNKKILHYSILISGLSFIFTLITPYGFTLYHFIFDYRDTFYQSHIQEWLSPFAFPIHYLQLTLNLLVITSFTGVVFSLCKKIPLFIYCIIFLLLYMAFKSVRHFPLLMASWFILIFPYFLPELTTKIKNTYSKFISFFIFTSLLSLSIFFLLSADITTKPFTNYCKMYPCEAAYFLKNRPELTKQLFNSYNFGGYLIGVSPELRLFIDGRLPQYPFNDHSILKEYYTFFDPAYSRKKLDEHGISTVLLQKNLPRHKINWFEKYFLGFEEKTIKSSSLLNHVSTSSNWIKVYEDKNSLIFTRKQ